MNLISTFASCNDRLRAHLTTKLVLLQPVDITCDFDFSKISKVYCKAQFAEPKYMLQEQVENIPPSEGFFN